MNIAVPGERRERIASCTLLALVVAWGCSRPAEPLTGPVILHDVTRDTGIKFCHTDGSSGRRYIVESVSAGLALFDYDNDGRIDIYFLNGAPLLGTKFDRLPTDALYRNEAGWKFTEATAPAGVGDTGFGLGVTVGDYDNDGLLDLFVTDYQGELPVLYENLGNGFFEDVTARTGASAGTLPYVNWGTGFVDFDNDGDRDLYIANGHIQDNIELYDDTTAYEVRNLLLLNDGSGNFIDVSDRSGDGMLPKLSSRGAAFDDLDNDGDVDVVVLNSRREPTILRNDSPKKHNWIQLSLRGVKANRDGVGARVTVVAGDLMLVDEVHSGRSYQSHYGSRLQCGLGLRNHVDRIEIRWVGGGQDVVHNVEVNRHVTIWEGGKTSSP